MATFMLYILPQLKKLNIPKPLDYTLEMGELYDV